MAGEEVKGVRQGALVCSGGVSCIIVGPEKRPPCLHTCLTHPHILPPSCNGSWFTGLYWDSDTSKMRDQ